MSEHLRMPITVASRRGMSALAATAAEQRVVLTNHGHAVAVVDSADRLDDSLRLMRDAAASVTDAFADTALSRRPATFDLDALCDRLGLDAATIRDRARRDAHIEA